MPANLSKKICLIGSHAVGKTSLVSRYVRQVFSERYLTTVGVKIDTKDLTLADDRSIKLIIWDIAGSDDLSSISRSYLRGAAGFLLVVDGTRANTLETAKSLKDSAYKQLGPIPFVCLVNKDDLEDEWEIVQPQLDALADDGWSVLKTSAMSGNNVELAFERLCAALIA